MELDEANLEEGKKTRLMLGMEISFDTSSKVLFTDLASLTVEGRREGKRKERERERERERMKWGMYITLMCILCRWDHP